MLRLSRLAPGLRALRTTFQSALPRAAAISFGASIATALAQQALAMPVRDEVDVLCVCAVYGATILQNFCEICGARREFSQRKSH